jgi:glutathione S-transferase
MDGAERVLYQFPISHYCEKTRWNLDAKGLSYRIEDLVPGWHALTTRRLAKIGTVPLLVDRGTVIGDSVAIAAHLERAYPERPLYPADEAARARALELEAYFGRRTGKAVRQWIYGHLAERPGAMTEVVLEAYPSGVRRIGKVAAPLLERAMRSSYRLTREGVAAARASIFEALDRVERETERDPARYLAGDALSIADVTAASLLGPLVAPPGSPWAATAAADRMPAPIAELRAELAQRPAWAWVVARYANDRRPARFDRPPGSA